MSLKATLLHISLHEIMGKRQRVIVVITSSSNASTTILPQHEGKSLQSKREWMGN